MVEKSSIKNSALFDLTDRIAIVTGGGTGIGKGISLELARAGAHVVIASPLQDINQKAAADIESMGQRSLAVQMDITVKEQVDNLMEQTIKEFGRIDIMVNNAGGSRPWQFDKISPKGWDAIVALNLKGPFLCCQAVGNIMISQKYGKIINISSGSGETGSRTMTHYAAAKAGVINLTKSLANLWGEQGVNVNCILPGFILTETVQAVWGKSNDELAQQIKSTPLRRAGLPEDIGHVVVFLASDAASYITGQAISVDGGISIATTT